MGMGNVKHTPEQIINKLRQAEVEVVTALPWSVRVSLLPMSS